ncbi:ABC transporter permease [Cellulomonas sp. NS3]|uniref:ABC transporter permease n=1 Tax=Cellulomonas sp. NS3 TaxID=2973977 RepID=UPI002161306C|nr:polyketide antibiotic transporter [Cellulomonas sp. NS3]
MTTLTRTHRTTPDTAPAPGTALTGTGRLLRFALRRDRVRIAVWALSIGALIGYFGAAIPVVYPDAAAMQTRAEIMKDPSGAFMTGPGYGLDAYSFGVMIANEMLGMIAVAVALMSVFLVVRHTRAEEESGRADLVRAGAVGRGAPLTAALGLLVVANVAVGGVLLAALLGSDLDPLDSLAVAAGAAAVGLTFGAVAAVTAQLSEHARTASGIAGALLGLAYVLRGVGDAQQRGGSALSWMSPVGWAQQTRAFVDLRWWPLLLAVGTTAVLVAAAFALVGRRDVGAGVVPSRRGRPAARRDLLSPAGLTLRTERATIAWWAVGLFAFAILTGSMAQGIVDSVEAQPQLAEVFGGTDAGDVLRSTLSAFLAFFAMAVAVYAVVSVNRLNREEDEGRTSLVLATAVSRTSWLGGSLAVTALGSALLLLTSGFGLGAGVAGSVGDPALVGEFTFAALVYLPVVLGFVGLAALAHGLRAGTWWLWVVLVVSIVVGLYGPLFNLPDAVLDGAPFALVPSAPYEAVTFAPLALISAAAAVLAAAGAGALRRRDLTA